MALRPFQDEQLNYFKFASIVLDEFPKALRQTFKSMWDKTFKHLPPWNDSILVRKLFRTKEGSTAKVPTDLSYEEWDCTALFQATIYARSFALPHKGHPKTLYDLYVKPHKLARGKFHVTVISSRGDDAETFALAIDQLRLLRNTLFHSTSSEIVKATFDQHVQLAKDAFKALGVMTGPIDVIGGLAAEDFPIEKVRKLEETRKEETLAYINFLQSNSESIEEIKGVLTKMKEDMANKEDIAMLAQKLNDRREVPAQEKPDLKAQPCLPPKVPHFTGRKGECDEITGHLASGSTRIVSIWGSPGFGKTSVSIAVGHQLHSQGWPVYYFSLRGLQSKADLASQLLSFFGRHATTGQQNPFSFDDELFKVLSDISHPFTIILDDADDLLSGGSEMKEDFTHFLAEILRRTEKLTIVITRRECLEFLNVQFQGHKAVRISRLDETSSQTLVSELLPKATVSDCQRVTNICGHLPLAMKLLCSFISEDDAEHCRVLDDFVLSLQNHNIVEMLDNPDYPSDLRLKLLFDSSFQKLSGQEKEALVSLCVLPESFDLTVAAAVLGTSQGEARRVLQTLRRKSLLESSSKPETFLMHQLILSFAKQRGENEMKEVILKSKVRLCAFYISRFESLNEQFLTGHSMSAFIDFYKDEQSITQSLIEGSSDFETAKQVFEVLVNADVFLYSLYRGKRSTFCKIYDSAKKAAKMLENKNFYRQLLISRALSQVTSVTRSGPMELISDAKDLEESCTPISDSDRGKRLCYNGIYHLANGRPDDGVQCLEDAVSSMNSSPEQRILRIIACQILAIYHRYKVNLLEMSQFYSKALQECKELGDTQLLVIPEGAGRCDKEDLNPKNSDTSNNQPLKNDIISFVNGATKQLCDNDTKEALTNAVLNIAEQIKEPTVQSSLGLFNFQNNVMTSLRQLRKYEDAAELSVSRISFHETTLEKSHGSKTQYTGREETLTSPTLNQEELAKSYSADASIHYKMQNYSEALKSDQRALEIRLERFGKEHQSTADSYHSLGRTQHRKGEFTSALQSKQRALDIRRKRFGEENSKTADSYHSIGRTQLALNDFSSARQSAQRALDIRLKLFGEENASTAESYQLLGATQHAQNDFSSALQSAQSALQIRLKIFGQQHPSTADSYYSLWVTQHKQRDYSSALQSAQSALQIRIDVCGKEHPSTADSYHSLGVTQHELGDVSTARHSAQRALDIRRKLFGEDDSSTVESDRLLKATECRLGDFSSTPHPTQRPRDIRLTRDKEEHSITADTYYSLGDTKLEKDDLCSASQSAPHAIDNWLKLSGEEHSSKGKGYDSSADTHAQGDLSSFLQSKELAFDTKL